MSDRHRIYGDAVSIKTENTRNFYNERAKAMESMANPYVAVLLGDQNPRHAEEWNRFEKDFVLPQLRISQTNSVLDIGCGIGRWAESIIPHAGYYCGTDFSSEMIEAAHRRNSYSDRDYDFYNLSFQETVSKSKEFYKKQFDRLIVGGVCMYINDEELPGCYEGVLKLLDERCIIYFTETVAVEKRLTLDECPSEALKTNYDVIYRTPDEYKGYYSVFTDAGFVVKEQKYLPHLNNEKPFYETDRWYTILER
ncbi:methyltransferase [Cohnella zeiphila]|uniref:Class I SAM-dependent methyltransferase n=1 Tax=Cohnella zeiphila TaxID=2761120 RepID=A0A7X0VVT6_9BACL|nr:class I SAM-dependent methyltransferase [Cohnella zeiphila]